MKRVFTFLLSLVLVLQLFVLGGQAADINGNQSYQPLDLVVVIDTSGSMNFSDSAHMTASAVNMLINMMPAEDSRLGIVTFNTKPTALTTDADGNPALLTLKELQNVKDIKQKVSAIAYKGDTGIGNAIKMATDILSEQSQDASRQKAVLLFTDGVDDFGADQLGLATCKENQGTAVQWATINGCPIYCIGYNYQNSMGPNAEGITKLENIARPTGGQAKAFKSIDDIEDMFISMLANICNLHYVNVQKVPGDGKRHEVPIQVSPEVIEANVRIECSTKSAVQSGKIELYNPNGEKVALQNGNGVRYDVDATAASIKVLSPMAGEWTLVLDGIVGEEILIGLLEHYKLGITSRLILPASNPADVAYIGDNIGVEAYLTTDNAQITDTAIYETVTTAHAVVTPRVNPQNQVVYALSFDGTKYVGSFDILEDSVYDVEIEISSGSFIRKDNLTVKSSNHPLVLDRNIENVKLNKNKQIEITDIYSYVSDPELDNITAEVTNVSEPDMAKVELKDDKIVIDGLGWGATNVTVTYTDAHGNTVNSTFKVSVNDPVAWAIIITILFILAVIALLIAKKFFEAQLKIKGNLVLTKLEVLNDIELPLTLEFRNPYEDIPDGYDEISFNINLDFYRKKPNRNVKKIMDSICYCFRNYPEDDERTVAMNLLESDELKPLFVGADRVKLLGSLHGRNGFSFKLPGKKARYIRICNVNKGKVNITNGRSFEMKFDNNIDIGNMKKHSVILTFSYFEI